MIGVFEIPADLTAVEPVAFRRELARFAVRKDVRAFRKQSTGSFARISRGMQREEFLRRYASEICLPGFGMVGETRFEPVRPFWRIVEVAGLPSPFAPQAPTACASAFHNSEIPALARLIEQATGNRAFSGAPGMGATEDPVLATIQLLGRAHAAGKSVLFQWERSVNALGEPIVDSRIEVIDLSMVDRILQERNPEYIVSNYEAGLIYNQNLALKEDAHAMMCDARALEALVPSGSRCVASEGYAMEAFRILLRAAEVGTGVAGEAGLDHVARVLSEEELKRLRSTCADAADKKVDWMSIAVGAGLAEEDEQDYDEPDGRMTAEIRDEVAPELEEFLAKRPRKGMALYLGVCTTGGP